MLNNWQCDCGFDLQDMATEEAMSVRSGQRRISVTCPVCETIYAFAVDWTPIVRPEPVGSVVTAKGA